MTLICRINILTELYINWLPYAHDAVSWLNYHRLISDNWLILAINIPWLINDLLPHVCSFTAHRFVDMLSRFLGTCIHFLHNVISARFIFSWQKHPSEHASGCIRKYQIFYVDSIICVHPRSSVRSPHPRFVKSDVPRRNLAANNRHRLTESVHSRDGNSIDVSFVARLICHALDQPMSRDRVPTHVTRRSSEHAQYTRRAAHVRARDPGAVLSSVSFVRSISDSCNLLPCAIVFASIRLVWERQDG